jgi:hypothetical protein
MRLAVILATIAAPDFASDSAMFGGTGCKLTLTPGQPHVAEVHCRNVLEGGSPVNRARPIFGAGSKMREGCASLRRLR